MTIELHDAINGDDLLDVLGKAFHAIDVLNTARADTVPTEVEDFLSQAKLLVQDVDYDRAVGGIPAALNGWKTAGGTLSGPLRTACEKILIEAVQRDSEAPASTLSDSLEYLIDQMQNSGDYVAALSSISHLQGGSNPAITHTTTVRGDDGAYKGRALRLDSDGATELALYHPLTLIEDTVYFCHLRITRRTNPDESSSVSASSASSSLSVENSSSSSSPSSPSSASSSLSSSSSGDSSSSSSVEYSSWSSSSPSSNSPSSSSTSSEGAEEIRVEIVDGIGGSVTNDSQGRENALRIDASAISTDAHDSQWFSFRVTRTTAQPVYLRIRFVSPPAAGDSIYIDQVAVALATELYAGGPLVAAFSSATPAVVEDAWTLTATNNRAGSLQEWFHRAFDMAGKGLLLPTAGSTLIPDSLVG